MATSQRRGRRAGGGGSTQKHDHPGQWPKQGPLCVIGVGVARGPAALESEQKGPVRTTIHPWVLKFKNKDSNNESSKYNRQSQACTHLGCAGQGVSRMLLRRPHRRKNLHRGGTLHLNVEHFLSFQ